jgi:hypothetical protein
MKGYTFIYLCGLGGEVQQLDASCKTTHPTHHGQCAKAHPSSNDHEELDGFDPIHLSNMLIMFLPKTQHRLCSP